MGKNARNVNISFWEKDQFFKPYDLIVIGSGIVGLFTAFNFKKKHSKSSVLILERGVLPFGASTKNAGFACFGSVTELLDDLSRMNENEVWETVQMRWNGLGLLKKTLGEKAMDYKGLGGYEIFNDETEYQRCQELMHPLNARMKEVIGKSNVYAVANDKIKSFGLAKVNGMLINRFEGQIDTGKMMRSLMELVRASGVEWMNGINVSSIQDHGNYASVTNSVFELKAKKIVVATNGFARELLKLKDVHPARAQVLITKPIKGLKLNGSFHYQQGYYYFRNINGRVLFGGGRNLDFKGETTTTFDTTPLIQRSLERILRTVILPNVSYEIDHRWAGIMGVGSEKKPIIKHISPNVIAAVRMGGMGVAIGSLVGKEAALLCE